MRGYTHDGSKQHGHPITITVLASRVVCHSPFSTTACARSTNFISDGPAIDTENLDSRGIRTKYGYMW
jgi:hypothetical protein